MKHYDPRTRATLPMNENGDIVCKRTEDDELLFNLGQLVVHHSPTGFNWGYGGSGPADFALNILQYFGPPGNEVDCFRGRCSQFAWNYHHQFKREFIAALPKEGGVIPGEVIRKWIEAHQ
jgi:hypothetical protein